MTQTAKFSSQRLRLPTIKHLIAIGSGKGGVGKSTTTVNLARALQQQGQRVGILDADIYGPNQPQMLFGESKQAQTAEQKFIPIEADGIATMSLGYLIDDDTPLIWRGPMVTKMFQQLLLQTHWGELDILLIDLPPGTGDVQLTLAKKIQLTGSVIVTTPQTVATADAQRAIDMFQKTEVNILGVIENMSHHICTACGHQDNIFGHAGGSTLAEKKAVPLLGRIPLDTRIRTACDQGASIGQQFPDDPITKAYQDAAAALMTQIHLHRDAKPSTFPDIVVE
jgi:ATP-binding protein involved in chromosome partitioning